MKRVAWGIVVGGAVAAAFAGSGVAGATGSTWTPDYDVGGAQLFVGPSPVVSPYQFGSAWELPAIFTSSTGTILTGTDYLTLAPGGLNDEFVTEGGAVYDQNQLGGGFTNLYYDAGTGHAAVDMMKTPVGNIDLSWMASSFAPDFATSTFPAATTGDNLFADQPRVGAALGLYNNIGGYWSGGPTDSSAITALQAPDSSLVWSAPATYTEGTGADVSTLIGTEYVTSPGDVEFVTDSGAVFDEKILSSGLFPVDNLYYDPVNGPAVDELQTIFGNVNLSPIASWFAPVDVADLVTPAPLTDLADAGLYSVLDLGLPS